MERHLRNYLYFHRIYSRFIYMNAATNDPGNGKNKNFLTHQRGRETSEHSNDAPQILEAQAIKKRRNIRRLSPSKWQKLVRYVNRVGLN